MPTPPEPRSVVFAVLIIIFYLNSWPEASGQSGGGFMTPREAYHAHLSRQWHAHDTLNTSRYGDFAPYESVGTYLNLTGFRETDGYAWEGLAKVKEWVEVERQRRLGGDKLQGGATGLYQNVTGIVKGKWVRSPREIARLVATGKERLNLTQLAPSINWGYGVWNHNITGREGKIVLTIEEKDIDGLKGQYKGAESENNDEPTREASATMTIQDETSTGDGWEIRLHGVHWPRRGALVLTTTSDKYAGLFGLPHMMTEQEGFKSSQRILSGALDAVLKKKERSIWMDSNDPWSSNEQLPVPHCEFVVYVQVHPVREDEIYDTITGIPRNSMLSMEGIEKELRFPNGAPILEPPPLCMSLVVFSPDCGFALESKGPPAYAPEEGQHLKGLKHEVYLRMVKHWSLVWTFTLLGQVLLLRLQMKEASTPSTVSRISYYTIATMVAIDALLFGCLMLLASAAPAVFPTATLASFTDFLSIGLGVKFTSDVYTVQEPERQERWQERERGRAARSSVNAGTATPTAIPVVTAAGADSLPPPLTATSGVSADVPIIIPSDQDIGAEIAEMEDASATALPTNTQRQDINSPRDSSDMTSSWGILGIIFISFLLVTLSSISWPLGIRSAYINGVSFIYLSFWTPQIYRNVIRNCRKALLWKFVIGQSVLRATPFIYFYMKEDNVLFAETSEISLAVLLGWLWIQIWILAAQEVLGPRFGLPKGWLPEAWDYHPILIEDDAESGGMPIGLVQAPSSPGLERASTSEEGKKKSDGHMRCVDCAICMMVLEVPVVPVGVDGSGLAGVAGVNGMLARRQYMVTPCRHTFHSVCLEGWMRFRLQCPICRENLPPL